jgi:formate hydrogenlyase transcriptional activator
MNQDDSSSHLLALASLFKNEFSIDWLAEMTDEKPSQILEVMERGLAPGWLSKKAPGIFFFTDLDKKTSFSDFLSPQEKEYRHRQIASLLSNLLIDNRAKAQELSCHLFFLPKGKDRAKSFLNMGDLELASYNTEEALQFYKKVLDDIVDDHTEEGDALFIKTAVKYSKLSMARENTQQVMALLQEAMDRAGKENREIDLILLKMHLAKNEWLGGRAVQAFRLFEESWAQVQAIDNPALFRAASAFRIFFFYWQGRYKEAVSCYEESVPDVEKFPLGGFSLMASILAGYCYAISGQTTQGLGMMDAIRTHYRNKGEAYLALYAEQAIAAILMVTGRREEAFDLFEKVLEESKRKHVSWISYISKFSLAWGYIEKGDVKRGKELLNEGLSQSRQVHVNTNFSPILLEFCWAMEVGRLPKVVNLNLEREIQIQLQSGNLHCQGIAYRYKAFLQERQGRSPKMVIQSLDQSLKYLEESGHQMEFGRALIQLARRHLAQGHQKKAEEMARQAFSTLSPYNKNFFPEDLKSLIRDTRPNRENLLEEILRLSQETVTIRDGRELVHHIISTVNRITSAERGAIFLLNENKEQVQLEIKASRNLTQDEINSPGFRSSMKMIETVTRTGLGQIKNESSSNGVSYPEKSVRSRICVPLVIRSKVFGVLYHDNRLLPNTFGDSDLEFLSYFATQAAIALDNSQAYQEVQIKSEKLLKEKQYYEEENKKILHFEDIIGQSPALCQVFSQMDQVSATETTVLITGETGVGKELVASNIHRHSRRSDKPFIRVHCSALPESLIPSELFGHEKGAFTGAVNRRIGRFELADGGTIFLDEVGDLSLEVQVRLLRVLQTKEFERIGGTKTIHSDFRLVAATNRDLETMVKSGQFRADLYYRLNVFPVHVPPLRERRQDIPLLTQYFLKLHAAKLGKDFEPLAMVVLDRLCRYDWPGNIRELENIIERGVIHSPEPTFRMPDLDIVLPTREESETELGTLRDAERHHIQRALQKTGWRVRGQGGAAELLDVLPSTLEFRMKKLGIKRPPEVTVKRNSRHY